MPRIILMAIISKPPPRKVVVNARPETQMAGQATMLDRDVNALRGVGGVMSVIQYYDRESRAFSSAGGYMRIAPYITTMVQGS